jgi:uncharacterized protein
MSTLFLDSSVIVKIYYTEEGSAWIRRMVNDKANICLISLIAVAEVAAAFAQIQRETSLGRKRMNEMYERFRADLRQGVFLGRVLDLAANLALQHILKGYDAVQLASGILLRNILADAEIIFVSNDQQMLRAARAEGLVTEDPEDHTDEDRQQ